MSWRARVGAATTEVPVPVGTPLAGFAARTSPSTGVHDPMTVRALVVDRTGLVVVDCCVLHEDTCAEIRGHVVPEVLDEVVVAATHTHAGPCIGLGRVGQDSPQVREAMTAAAVAALRLACATATSCTAAHAAVRGLGIAMNRRHLDAEIDPPLHVVSFEDGDRNRVATVLSYPGHPVVLDAANTLVSADYIGPLREQVEAVVGGTCLFLTGAAGDVNMGAHSAAASFTPQGAGVRTFEEAERIGHLLADAAVCAALARVSGGSPARAHMTPVTLALQALDRDLVSEQVRGWRAELSADPPHASLLTTWLEWADRLPPEPPTSWAGRVGVLEWGTLRLVTLPGEPFLAAAEQLADGRSEPVIVLGYCDGVPGYLPTRSEYPLGGYEVEDAHRYYSMPTGFAPGSLEQLLDAARQLLDATPGHRVGP